VTLYIFITVQAMPKKIDDLFSPERLRKSWQKTKERTGGPVRAEREEESPLQIFERLRDLIQRNFSGEDSVALNLLLDDLYVLLERMYLKAEESPIPADSLTDMFPAVHDMLNRIEDLAEAFEIAGRNRNRK
jgi:hypothetical protein